MTAVLIVVAATILTVPAYYYTNLNMNYMPSTGVGNVPYTFGGRLSLVPGLRGYVGRVILGLVDAAS